MPGQVEQLSQPEHEGTHHMCAAPYFDGVRTNDRRRYGQRRQDEGVAVRQRFVNGPSQG